MLRHEKTTFQITVETFRTFNFVLNPGFFPRAVSKNSTWYLKNFEYATSTHRILEVLCFIYLYVCNNKINRRLRMLHIVLIFCTKWLLGDFHSCRFAFSQITSSHILSTSTSHGENPHPTTSSSVSNQVYSTPKDLPRVHQDNLSTEGASQSQSYLDTWRDICFVICEGRRSCRYFFVY